VLRQPPLPPQNPFRPVWYVRSCVRAREIFEIRVLRIAIRVLRIAIRVLRIAIRVLECSDSAV
jgi:hypothetical protein